MTDAWRLHRGVLDTAVRSVTAAAVHGVRAAVPMSCDALQLNRGAFMARAGEEARRTAVFGRGAHGAALRPGFARCLSTETGAKNGNGQNEQKAEQAEQKTEESENAKAAGEGSQEKQVEELRKQMADLEKQLKEKSEQVAKLTDDNKELKSRVLTAMADVENMRVRMNNKSEEDRKFAVRFLFRY